jgi:hypothetical protein
VRHAASYLAILMSRVLEDHQIAISSVCRQVPETSLRSQRVRQGSERLCRRSGNPPRRGQRALFMGVRDETCGDAERDGRVEPRETEAYSKQYVEVRRGEPAHQHVACGHAGLSQRRIRSCSRNPHG